MAPVTCSNCSNTFETAARSNRTRCGACRSVVRVPVEVRRANGWSGAHASSGAEPKREHTVALLLLECGHAEMVIVHPGRSVRSEAFSYSWTCPDTGADVEAARVIAQLSETEWNALDDDGLRRLVEGAGGRLLPA